MKRYFLFAKQRDIPQVEQEKIDYARKFFKALQDNLKQNEATKHIKVL
nr:MULTISPECIES: hypothetical protein [unclassified Campylobacter]